MENVSAILLGAGESKRMGMNKLTLPWGRKTVLEHCMEVLLRSDVREVIVVLSDRTKELAERIKGPRVKVLMNPRYREGMSTSIRQGLQAADPKSQGIVIALGDQPRLRAKTVNALIHAFVGGKGMIIVPSYRGRRGHPVLFDRRYIRALRALKRDVGGRSILEKHPKNVSEIRTRSKGVVFDIDTRQDYERELRQ